MKIEGNGPNPAEVAGAQRTDAARSGGINPGGRGTGGDRVDVSENGQFVNGAIKAAADSPDIRHGLVERARQKLATGELGRDVLRLADRLIDHLLER